MSKKPLLSEGTARRWAKYAGIQNESTTLLSEMYDKKDHMKEEALEEEALEEEALEEEALEEGETLEEADVLAELEQMLAEQEDDEEEDLVADTEAGEEAEEMAADDELDVDADEAEEEMDMEDEAGEAAMMSQEDVEAALKAGLEAMASAVADALKIKIDVRSGDEGEEMEAEEEVMEIAGMDHGGMEEEMDPAMEEGAYGMKYEGINRDELVERVMKRVAARLVKESKEG